MCSTKTKYTTEIQQFEKMVNFSKNICVLETNVWVLRNGETFTLDHHSTIRYSCDANVQELKNNEYNLALKIQEKVDVLLSTLESEAHMK